MEKIKRYLECYVPITTCNLNCHYCYITRQKKWKDEIKRFPYNTETMCRGLSKERMGGACLINLCGGGETLLMPELIQLVKGLIDEGHYVMIVTNGTVGDKLEEYARLPKDVLSHLIFKFSYHFFELRNKGKTEEFFGNIKKIHRAGASFTLEMTPNDEIIKYIPEIKQECMEHLGALCHITIARDDLNEKIPILTKKTDEEFYDTWGQFHSTLFDFKKTIFGEHRKEFCYAGEWSLYIDLGTGMTTQCYCGKELGNIFENVENPIYFLAIGTNCTAAHCYNGHAFLSLGVIPELETPSYGSLRNRLPENEKCWIQPEMYDVLSGKLSENNQEYNKLQKYFAHFKNRR